MLYKNIHIVIEISPRKQLACAFTHTIGLFGQHIQWPRRCRRWYPYLCNTMSGFDFFPGC